MKQQAQRAPREADFFAPSIHCITGFTKTLNA